KAKDGDKKEAAKPATAKVKKGPFHIDVSLDGVFEAQDEAELVIRPQEWPQLQVLKAVDHGTAVKQGDLVLALDTEKIDHTIAELRAELQLNELSVKQSEAQLAALEKVAPLDSDANERAQRMAKEDWKLYQDVEKPLSVKMNEYRLKSAKEQLEYAEEEYRQLEKMYKADDLREETEKIVLRRAKNGVDRAKLSLEFAQASYNEAKKLSLPRQDERAKEQTERALIEVDLTKASIPLLMNKHRLELEKLKLARTQGEDKLNKLISDREAMVVKAPMDGIVYYGRCVRGKWAAMSHETLRRGAPVQPNDVFMTIVKPRPMIIRTTVPESQAQRIHAGQTAYVDPVGFVDQKLTAIVHRVGTVPMGGSGFDCQMTVASDALNQAIMPGMNCEMKLIPYKKSDALTVPPKAVFTEDLDPSKQYVFLVAKDGKPQKRTVTLGERNEKQAEVLNGLAAGDEILLEKPKEE
ncbi:MAG TPA: HlyD family efflux transporter periplasmic adaptor subunit, partial [Gemmataceae bacterium]|nr:HlyD family efflux transporter periplasmic adaptor subunit [Gemmataceae bacterium]